MNAGIITITGETNYGNSLQNYAVVKVLNKLNINARTVKTEYSLPEIIQLKKTGNLDLKHYIKFNVKLALVHKMLLYKIIRRGKFRRYNKKYINLSKKYTVETAPVCDNNYDIYVFGSDQIWNFNWGGRLCEGIEFFTGGFADGVKKVAYSASLGADTVPTEYVKTLAENLNDFSAISVREQKGVEILESIVDKKIHLTPDPTLMLEKREWLDIAKKPLFFNGNKKYVLTYFLGDYSQERIDYIQKIADSRNLEIVDLCGEWDFLKKRNKRSYYSFSPQEFIWLINNSEIMFTDSFHGCVFSILMNKNFRCFNRQVENEANMSSRMDTLFKMFGIENWCVADLNEKSEDVFFCNYSQVEETLNCERKKAYDYLKGALFE